MNLIRKILSWLIGIFKKEAPVQVIEEAKKPKSIPDHLMELEEGPFVRMHKKIPRNSKCLCGSGKKYKHCCMKNR